jgi:multiple sugar transport system permease protein
MSSQALRSETPAHDPMRRLRRSSSRILIYAALLLWAFICLFPIYWTVSTSFKTAVDVTRGHLIPWVDFQPDWKGWRSLGLSPDTIGKVSTVRDEFLQRFGNSVVASVGGSLLAIVIGSLAAYGLTRFQYRFGPWRNKDISFFFLSQLILPPVVLALPFLVLYKELALLDTKIGLIFIYTLTVLPIVIWIMRDQFLAIPVELEQAARIDGASIWGAFLLIVLPIALPGMVAALERVFLRLLAHQHRRDDAARDGGEPDRLAGDQLVVDGGALDGGDRASGRGRRPARALHREGADGRRGEVGALFGTEPRTHALMLSSLQAGVSKHRQHVSPGLILRHGLFEPGSG